MSITWVAYRRPEPLRAPTGQFLHPADDWVPLGYVQAADINQATSKALFRWGRVVAQVRSLATLSCDRTREEYPLPCDPPPTSEDWSLR